MKKQTIFKNALTIGNTLGRLEKGLVIAALVVTSVKLISYGVADITKTPKKFK